MIQKEDIEKLAELSCIAVTDEEVEKLSKDIESILEYVHELTEIAVVDGSHEAGILRNVMREDGKPHESSLFSKDLLEAAPELEKDYFKVKKILE